MADVSRHIRMECLDFVAIPTKHIEAMRNFYRDIIGLGSTRPDIPIGSVELYLGNQRILRLCVADVGDSLVPMNMEFKSSDSVDVFWSLLDYYKIAHTVDRIPYAKRLRVTMEDPDGNTVCVSFPDGTA